MAHYIISFTVYTLAMSGLIAFALFVYKRVMNGSTGSRRSKLLSVEETMSINPRKTLMIVKAGDERFLIASDVDKTTLIAKLGQNETLGTVAKPTVVPNTKVQQNAVIDLTKVKNTIDKRSMNVLYPQQASRPANKPAKSKPVIPQTGNVPRGNTHPGNTRTAATKSQQTVPQEPVHFEVITNRNPNAPERNRQRSYTVNRRRNIPMDTVSSLAAQKNHGISAIKDILQKVNEL